MRNVTGREVEKRAVSEFITYFEEQIDMVIRQSVRELDKKNGLEEIQGIRPQARIDQECISEAIKTINNNGHSLAPGRAGGTKKAGERYEKHMPEFKNKKGAEIT